MTQPESSPHSAESGATCPCPDGLPDEHALGSRGCVYERPQAENGPLPIDVAVGRAISETIAGHTMGVETSGGIFELGHGMFGAYHWCACGWRSDDGPWRDPAAYLRGLGQARIDHLSNAVNAAVRAHVDRAQAEVANAFVEWAAQNEIAEPPLDWDWFGEITRRYSPLHEEHEGADRG